eukprot:5464993-Prymnesium_polylepis.2
MRSPVVRPLVVCAPGHVAARDEALHLMQPARALAAARATERDRPLLAERQVCQTRVGHMPY